MMLVQHFLTIRSDTCKEVLIANSRLSLFDLLFLCKYLTPTQNCDSSTELPYDTYCAQGFQVCWGGGVQIAVEQGGVI